MTIKKLASQLAKLEGKKSQARIGDIRELLSHLSDLMWHNAVIHQTLSINGYRRSKRQAARRAAKRARR